MELHRYTIYPNLRVDSNARANPYIHDFIRALNKYGKVQNKASKNPLLDILFPKNWGDVFIFNWFESIPDYKYGLLQSAAAILFVLFLRCRRKQIVWVLHNRLPHSAGKMLLKRFMMHYMSRMSTFIITHATEGINIVRTKYPFAEKKVHYLDHPTKNRLALAEKTEVKYDLLIWGQISRYKGIVEFVRFVSENKINDMRVCIVGRCSSESLLEQLRNILPDNIELVNESPSFEELGKYVSSAHFVLAPYMADTVLSSGMLMDSLSYGAKVIGPDVGSFRDYSRNPMLDVYTFRSFADIPRIVAKEKNAMRSMDEYAKFLDSHDWDHFVVNLMEILNGRRTDDGI